MNSIENISNKTIIVQTSYHATPHLETEMELVERLLAQNNTIYWLICKKDFKTCFNNPTHEKWTCEVCVSRVKAGIKEVFKNIKNPDKLKIIEYADYLNYKEYTTNTLLKFDFETVSNLKKYNFNGYDVGMATASSLVSFTRNHIPNVKEHTKFIENGIKTGAYLFEAFSNIVSLVKPDLVILFNGRFIENRPLLRVCQQQKITYATHERGGKLDTFLFRINSIPHSIETISAEMEMLWNNASDDKEEVGKRFYTNRIQRVEDAWYSFTKEQQEGRLPESFSANEGKKVVTIFNSSLDEYEGLEGFGPYFYENDNVGIQQIAAALKPFENIKLYLRIHPNLKGLQNAQNDFIKQELEPLTHIEIIGAQDSVDTYALINKSDIIIVFGSTVGAEAAFAGKNVILLGKAAYENLNCFFLPKNHEETIEAIVSNDFVFPEIDTKETLKYGYWNENFGHKYQNYQPKNIAQGNYKGKKIKANPIIREIKRFFNR